MTSATLIEDRRDAVRGIKALAKKYKAEVGSQCLNTMVDVIRNDKMDTEIVSYALETLWSVMEVERGGLRKDETTMETHFTEEFLENPENISLLLELLEQFDFSIRRHTTCLLNCLLYHKRAEVQEKILVQPMGISKMMDLLSDSSEIIRNDALLLLIELTISNKQIQKIVAFENAFDRLLAIIRDEGYSDGGIIVQDCIVILHNLLSGNNSNQSFFREASLINHLVPFFDLKGTTATSWNHQKATNVHQMLLLVRILVSPGNPQQSTASCQKLVNQCGLLKLFCEFMFASGVPTELLTETINTVAEVIRGCQANQQYFEAVTTASNPPRSAVLALLMSMVTEKQPLLLRLSALYCFECYLHKNEAGQAQIINTLLPQASTSEKSISPGQVLIAGLFGNDPLSNWCTAIAIASALNDTLKPQLLRVQLSMQGKEQVTLLQQITMHLAQRSDLKVQTRIGLLILLCTWLRDCRLAVIQFLNDPSNISFLINQIELSYTNELGQLSRCLCATLLGLTLAFHGGGSSEYTPDTLRQIIAHRIGMDSFRDCLTHITRSELFTQAVKAPHFFSTTMEEISFDHNFVTLFKEVSDVIGRSLDSSAPVQSSVSPSHGNSSDQGGIQNTSIEDHDSIVTHYKELIRDQDEELTAIKKKFTALESARSQDASTIRQQAEVIQTLERQLAIFSELKEKGGVSGEGKDGEIEKLQNSILSMQRVQDSQRQELASKNVTLEQLRQELAEAKGKQAQQVSASSDKVHQAKEQVAQLQAENEALMTERDELDSQLKVLQDSQREQAAQQVSASSSTSSVDATQIAELQRQVSKLNITLRDVQEKNELMEKEQDDLLVLLANHDTKTKKYRSLLVEHNIELPEESEESEEDDEESEGEGEGEVD